MKIRNGFVSNSSSSSFLVVSLKDTNTPEEWREFFKNSEDIEDYIKKDTLDWTNRPIEEFIDEAVERIAEMSNKETEPGDIEEEWDFTSRKIKNWKELLKDKKSWLYEEFFGLVYHEFMEEIDRMDSEHYFHDEGRVSKELALNFGNTLRRGRWKDDKVDKAFDTFVEYLTDEYINHLIERLHEDSYMWYVNAASDGGDNVGMIMRYFWNALIHPEVEYFKFEHS